MAIRFSPLPGVCLALALATGVAHAQGDPVRQESPEVRRLSFDGVKSVSREELERSVYTDRSRCRSVIHQIFCVFSKAPAFYVRHYLDREELARDMLRIRVFYWKRGWRNADVDTLVTRRGEGVAVEFRVTENEPTIVGRQVVVFDTTLISESQVQRIVRQRAGDPLNMIHLDTSRVLLEQAMWDRGYADAVVDTAISVDTARRRASLTLSVVPGRRATVGQITILRRDEAPQVDPQVIMNSLTLRTGDVFRWRRILESQRNLYESNLFRLAVVRMPAQADSVKEIEVEVSEAPLRDARIGTGFNTIDYAMVEGRFTHYNILGGARRLDVSGRVGNLGARQINGKGIFRRVPGDEMFLEPSWQASVDLRQPAWLQRPENAIGVSVFGHRRSVAPVFVERGYGAGATYTRTLSTRQQASLSYRFEVSRVLASEVYFCVSSGVCDSTTVRILRAPQRISPIFATYHIDRTDETFNPTQGFVARGDLEHASSWTASAFRYNRLYGEGAWYFRMGRDRATSDAATSGIPRAALNTVLATRGRIGAVRPLSRRGHDALVLHPRKRFYAGGSQSVRGYQESQLGPRILTIDPTQLRGLPTTVGGTCDVRSDAIRFCDPNAERVPIDTGPAGRISDDTFIPRPLGGTSLAEVNAELRFHLWKKLSGVVFVDAGVVGQSPVQHVADVFDVSRATWAVTPGFGVRYHTLVGPIRIDVGINPRTTEMLTVVTEMTTDEGERRLVTLSEQRRYSPAQRLLDRAVLHLSIGQAF
jgi:outer membrane protein assembly factor BamA